MNHTTPGRESSTPSSAPAYVPDKYTFSQKWGDDPFTALGHTQAPNALIRYGARLGLEAEECWLITVILLFKHTPEDPYPAQARLAELIGKSEVTIRRWLKSIEGKKLMHVEHVRGDLGHYTHSVYDFQPLRAALNEMYYEDHPQERPHGSNVRQKAAAPATDQSTTDQKRAVAGLAGKAVKITTDQKRSVVQPPIKNSVRHRSDSASATDQVCRPNKSLEREERIEEEAAVAAPEVLASLFVEEEKPQKQEASPLSAHPFVDLPEEERTPWLEKAEAELRQDFGLSVWLKVKERAKGTIRAQRAANLYMAAQKEEKL